ncbi:MULTISPECIES: hypothetical protein [Streptomyces]|uniref:Protein kilB n=2 Tax=Streptomyces TaxID=1883 RepID=A0A3R7FYG5_9ACTN|nr:MULTISPECIES: hypothetical protein [Streptomyces]KNE83469.1 hypothetical protein ADZ36_05155 [Streptomyces fradiae]OFA61952.1 hypothetical protein BEN35_00525 [Streptomyces fradiae]PQM24274.1 hypothetical protein Sfr7A_05665 [Streptomyces xinghaiensis]RKM97239.1 hypothetical protein SFRA_008355 [Streptomyces xinghaiensis]RNC75366.1 hypothetical protein DC095_006245 [Streptomyces xinghaiensis]
MDATLSTLIAVVGTLLGSAVTHVFQRTADRRAQDFAAAQQLRAERMQVYSDFAGAVADFRRGQYDRWHRRDEDPDGPAHFESRLEAHRLRGTALHGLFRVQLIASATAVVDAARHAYELTSEIPRAGSKTELSAQGGRAKDALETFITLASSDVR